MPTLRQDSILSEFEFNTQESIGARTLSPLQIQWLQTKYAKVFKEKASTIVPEDSGLDRSYLLRLGEMEGRLALIQELFKEHQDVLNELADPDKNLNLQEAGNNVIDDTATRASNLVD